MAQWQMLKRGTPVSGPIYDDGDPYSPGDPEFSSAKATAQVAASNGAADGINYVGASEAAQQ